METLWGTLHWVLRGAQIFPSLSTFGFVTSCERSIRPSSVRRLPKNVTGVAIITRRGERGARLGRGICNVDAASTPLTFTGRVEQGFNFLETTNDSCQSKLIQNFLPHKYCKDCWLDRKITRNQIRQLYHSETVGEKYSSPNILNQIPSCSVLCVSSASNSSLPQTKEWWAVSRNRKAAVAGMGRKERRQHFRERSPPFGEISAQCRSRMSNCKNASKLKPHQRHKTQINLRWKSFKTPTDEKRCRSGSQ